MLAVSSLPAESFLFFSILFFSKQGKNSARLQDPFIACFVSDQPQA
jgi:hypothetical protein